MCLGIPMTVEALLGAGMARCRAGDGHTRVVSLLLLGDLAPGTPVLVHVDTAVRVLDPAEVRLIEDALQALAASLEGRPFDHLFADLVGRTPELPPHLRPAAVPPAPAAAPPVPAAAPVAPLAAAASRPPAAPAVPEEPA